MSFILSSLFLMSSQMIESVETKTVDGKEITFYKVADVSKLQNPKKATKPIHYFKCLAKTPEKKKLSFDMKWIGKRGYKDPSTGKVKTTSDKFIFSGKNAEWFNKYEMKVDLENKYIDGRYHFPEDYFPRNRKEVRKIVPLGGHIRIRLHITQFFRTDRNKVGITIHSQDRPERVFAMGYCDKSSKKQSPLSNKEIAMMESMK